MADAARDAAPQLGPSDAAREAASNAPVGFARRKNRQANIRKRAAEEDAADEGEGGVQRKAQRAKEGQLAFTTRKEDKFETFKFDSSNILQQTTDQGATRELETETQKDRDGRCVVAGMAALLLAPVIPCSSPCLHLSTALYLAQGSLCTPTQPLPWLQGASREGAAAGGGGCTAARREHLPRHECLHRLPGRLPA